MSHSEKDVISKLLIDSSISPDDSVRKNAESQLRMCANKIGIIIIIYIVIYLNMQLFP